MRCPERWSGSGYGALSGRRMFLTMSLNMRQPYLCKRRPLCVATAGPADKAVDLAWATLLYTVEPWAIYGGSYDTSGMNRLN